MSRHVDLQRANYRIPTSAEAPALERARKALSIYFAEDQVVDLETAFGLIGLNLLHGEKWFHLEAPGQASSAGFELVEALAPWVADGSYVTWQDEGDEDPTTWYFVNGKCEDAPRAKYAVLVGVRFAIAEEDGAKALRAVQRGLDDHEEMAEAVEDASSLDTIFDGCGWIADEDDDGAFILRAPREREERDVTLDEWLFERVARWVKPGSEIAMRTDDVAWKWVFDGKRCRRVYGA